MKKFISIVLSVALVLSCFLMLEFSNMAEETYSPTVTNGGIIINEDAHNTLCGAISDPSWKATSTTGRPIRYDLTSKDEVLEGIKQTMHNYANTQVTDVVIASNFQYSFSPSEVMEDVEDKWKATQTWSGVLEGQTLDFSKTLVDVFYTVLYEHDIDLYREWFTQLEKDNINGWLSVRMNDIHDYGKVNGERNSLFNYTAYDNGYTIGNYLGSDFGGMRACLDYAEDIVYNRYINYIEEQVKLYSDVIDGIELDYQRESFCFEPGNEAQSREIMTRFIREVKTILTKNAPKGKKIKLSVRVPRDIAQCYNSGFDVLTWAKEGLIDTVTVSPRNTTCDTDMPISSWVKVLNQYNVKVNAGVESIYRSAGNKDAAREVSLENDYALATQYLSQGADKMYYFNHYTTWINGNNQPFDSSLVTNLGTRQELLENGGSLQTLKNKNKSYLVSYQDVTGNFIDSTYSYSPLPLNVAQSTTSENLRIKTGIPTENGKAAVIIGYEKKDGTATASTDISVYLNGKDCAFEEEAYCYENKSDSEYYSKFFYDATYTKGWFKKDQNVPKYRLGPNNGVKTAYAFTVSYDSLDKMEQILKFTNNSDSEIEITYVELRFMAPTITEDYIRKECVDYAEYKQVTDGMRTTQQEIRAVAKIYKETKYGSNEWIKYNVEAKTSGVYDVYLRGASTKSGCQVKLESTYSDTITADLSNGSYGPSYLGQVVLLKDDSNAMTVSLATDSATIYLDCLEFKKVRDIADADTKENVTVDKNSLNTTDSKSGTYSSGSTGISLYDNASLVFNFTTNYDGEYSMKGYFKANGNGKTVYYNIDGVDYAKVISPNETTKVISGHTYYETDFGTVSLTAGEHTLTVKRGGSGAFDFNSFDFSRIGTYVVDYVPIKLTDSIFSAEEEQSVTVSSPAKGFYKLSCEYLTTDISSITFAANDTSISFTPESTSNARIISSVLGIVYLKEGENTLTITNSGTTEAKIYNVYFELAETLVIPLNSFDTENSSYDTANSNSEKMYIYGWGNHKLTYNVDIPEDGTYILCLDAVNSYRDFGYSIAVDGMETTSQTFPYSSGASWSYVEGKNYYKVFKTPIIMDKGNHTLKITPNNTESSVFGIALYKID